jgi:hypothetical protein
MENFSPKTGSELEWNAAYCRLEDYLCALHIVGKMQQNQIILRLLKRAADKHAENQDLCPTVLAMEEMRAAMDWWFGQILASKERVSVMGFLSLLATALPEKWPAAFLAEDIPADCQRTLLAGAMYAVPELQVSSMVPQPFANPLLDGISFTKSAGKLMGYLSPLVLKIPALVMAALPNPPGNQPH